MLGFHDVDGDVPEDFDWFPETNQDGAELLDYLGITDLREIAENAIPQETLVHLDETEFILGDIEEDQTMWKYCEKPVDAAEGVFDAISEKLCGDHLPECSGVPARYIEQLARRCEIVQTELGPFDTGRQINGITARMEACFLDHGCLAAMVSDAQWRQLIGEPESPFVDSGVRMLQIIGMKQDDIVVNDFANLQGRSLEISKGAFCALYGILIEVYK